MLPIVHLRTNEQLSIAADPDATMAQRDLGYKTYEMSNHLGNVLSTITDRKIPVDDDGTGGQDGVVDFYVADVTSATDYYPFGTAFPGRSQNLGGYRFVLAP